jgi:pyrroline-5-carboxylate reductase-like protein/aconitase family protein (aconitate hydratase)
MPNAPATVHEGMAGICAGAHAGDEQLALAEELLSHLGRVVRVPETWMDAITAVSGSGPAYFALLAEAMIEAGILLGLSRELSTTLVVQTMYGTAKQLRDQGMHPVELRESVTSPGGTTIAAIRELEQAGVRAAFLNAIQAAMDRLGSSPTHECGDQPVVFAVEARMRRDLPGSKPDNRLLPCERTLIEKVWQSHIVRQEDGHPDLLYVDLHLVHEVTSPQAFEGLRLAGRRVRRPDLTLATMDHNVATGDDTPLDSLSEQQLAVLRSNCAEFGVPLCTTGSGREGIVHVIGQSRG